MFNIERDGNDFIVTIAESSFRLYNCEKVSSAFIERVCRDWIQMYWEDDYVEKEKAFLNPDLSVFMLAEHLHTSEDDIIDAIHYSQGIPFGDYIDSLRVQHAVSIILAEHLDKDNPDTLVRIAHQSGFLSTDALENAWDRIFHTSIEKSQLFN